MSPGASRRSSAFWRGRDAHRYLRRRARPLAAGAVGRNLPAGALRAALLARARGLRAAWAPALGLAAGAGAADRWAAARGCARTPRALFLPAPATRAPAAAAVAGACGAPAPSAAAAVAARLPLPQRPKRAPRSGAAASSARHSSSVRALGSRSLGILAFFLRSVMYGP